MDKVKVIKTCLKIGAIVMAGAATLINDKLAKEDMTETVAKKVSEALANKVEES